MTIRTQTSIIKRKEIIFQSHITLILIGIRLNLRHQNLILVISPPHPGTRFFGDQTTRPARRFAAIRTGWRRPLFPRILLHHEFRRVNTTHHFSHNVLQCTIIVHQPLDQMIPRCNPQRDSPLAPLLITFRQSPQFGRSISEFCESFFAHSLEKRRWLLEIGRILRQKLGKMPIESRLLMRKTTTKTGAYNKPLLVVDFSRPTWGLQCDTVEYFRRNQSTIHARTRRRADHPRGHERGCRALFEISELRLSTYAMKMMMKPNTSFQ